MKLFILLIMLSTQVLAGPGGVGGGNGHGPIVVRKKELLISPTLKFKLSDIKSVMLANGAIIQGEELANFARCQNIELIDIQLKSGEIIVIKNF